jgi:hypothetical protein
MSYRFKETKELGQGAKDRHKQVRGDCGGQTGWEGPGWVGLCSSRVPEKLSLSYLRRAMFPMR